MESCNRKIQVRMAHSSILSITWSFNASKIEGTLQTYTFIRRRNKGSNKEWADIATWASSWYLDNEIKLSI